MTGSGSAPDPSVLRERARRERQRAARAAGLADRHQELLADAGLSARIRDVLRQSVRVHRTAELRHRTTAQVYLAVAVAQETRRRPPWGATLLGAVGRVGRARGAVLSLPVGGVDAVLATDERARALHETEVAAGEGPAHDCLAGGPFWVGAEELASRWPAFGPAAAGLGVRSVGAAPMPDPERPGSLVLLDAPRTGPEDLDTLAGIVRTLAWSRAAALDGAVLGAADFDQRPVLHQAAGMVSVQLGCGVGDALALLRARAFAENVDPATVARSVVAGERLFTAE